MSDIKRCMTDTSFGFETSESCMQKLEHGVQWRMKVDAWLADIRIGEYSRLNLQTTLTRRLRSNYADLLQISLQSWALHVFIYLNHHLPYDITEYICEMIGEKSDAATN